MIAEVIISIFIYFVLIAIYEALEQMYEVLYR